MSLNLWLIRHGQTTVNSGKWSVYPQRCLLTPLGEVQAKAAATKIKKQPHLLITSPWVRAQLSAKFILERWPKTPSSTWPIQEFLYLSPSKMQLLDSVKRQAVIDAYWKNSDPYYIDDGDSESFEAFLERIKQFHIKVSTLEGFVVVVGHAHFLKGYQLGLQYGFNPSPEWMTMYRCEELNHPISNGEILSLYFN